MSKNITIKEGGTGRSLADVAKLRTLLVGTGTVDWVPEDEVAVGEKTITENGTYTASADGVYGWNVVKVNVPGGSGNSYNSGGGDPSNPDAGTNNYGEPGGPGSAVTGTDGDGDEAIVTPDHDTGALVEKKVPSGIRITTPPMKLTYDDGELIDFSGLVVKAMLKATGEFTDEKYPAGIIPRSELDFPQTVAAYSGGGEQTTPGTDESRFYQATGHTFSYTEVGVGTEFTYQSEGRTATIIAAEDRVFCTMAGPSGSYDDIYLASAGSFTIRFKDWNGSTSIINCAYYEVRGYATCGIQTHKNLNAGLPYNSREVILHSDAACWDMAHLGKKSMPGAGQTIPVQWVSPYDGRTFQDAFEITVEP